MIVTENVIKVASADWFYENNLNIVQEVDNQIGHNNFSNPQNV